MSTPATTQPVSITSPTATVLDITDRLPEHVEQPAEVTVDTVTAGAPDRAYTVEETLAVQDRWAMLLMTAVGIAGTLVFAASFVVLGLPQGGADGIGATAGVSILVLASMLVASVGASALREDFARFSAGR